MRPIEEIEDYKEAAQILADEFAALGWHKTIVLGTHLVQDKEWPHYAWTVIFAPPYKAPVALPYKCGTGHVYPQNAPYKLRGKPKPPAAAEVLACYCRSLLDSDCAFDEWAENFGYDPDSRQALRTYDECRATGPKLRALGLTREQIARFAALSALL